MTLLLFGILSGRAATRSTGDGSDGDAPNILMPNLTCQWDALYTAANMSAMNPECFRNVSAADLASIPNGEACAGITAAQGTLLGNTFACAGLFPSCVSSISISGVSGFQENCVGALTSEAVGKNYPLTMTHRKLITLNKIGALNTWQVANIPASGFSGFTKENVAGLGLSCAGLQADQITALGKDGDKDVCGGIMPECGASMNASNAVGFTHSCISYTTAAFVASLSKDAISSMSPLAFIGFQDTNLPGLTLGCAGMNAQQVFWLDNCQKLQGACLESAPLATFEGFLDTCTSSWLPSHLKSVTLEKILKMGASGCYGFSVDAWAYLVLMYREGIIDRLTIDQLYFANINVTMAVNRLVDEAVPTSRLAPYRDLCTEESREKLENLTWVQLSFSGVRNLSCLTVSDFFRVRQGAYFGLRAGMVQDLRPNIIPYIASDSLEYFTTDALQQLNAEQIAAFWSDNLYGLIGRLQVTFLPVRGRGGGAIWVRGVERGEGAILKHSLILFSICSI